MKGIFEVMKFKMGCALLMIFSVGCMPFETGENSSIEEAPKDRTVHTVLEPSDVLSIVIGEWPRPVSDYCLDAADGITVNYTADIKGKCNDAGIACIFIYERQIYLAADRKLLAQYEDLGHEDIHFLVHCMDGDSDKAHAKKIYWACLDPEGSVEARVNEILWAESR
jgi:hypothetical protein